MNPTLANWPDNTTITKLLNTSLQEMGLPKVKVAIDELIEDTWFIEDGSTDNVLITIRITENLELEIEVNHASLILDWLSEQLLAALCTHPEVRYNDPPESLNYLAYCQQYRGFAKDTDLAKKRLSRESETNSWASLAPVYP